MPVSSSPLPKSLKNIFKELEEDLGIYKEHGDLTSWARQGVLLLNSVLTTKIGTPEAHKDIGWQALTDEVIKKLSDKHNVIFVLMGNYAKQKKKLIDADNNFIIETPHPSPLSAYRGFFASKIFSQINSKLKIQNKESIKF